MNFGFSLCARAAIRKQLKENYFTALCLRSRACLPSQTKEFPQSRDFTCFWSISLPPPRVATLTLDQHVGMLMMHNLAIELARLSVGYVEGECLGS